LGELLLRVRYHPVSGPCTAPAPSSECASLPSEERRQWQAQLDDARLQADQDIQAAHAEDKRLRQEAETLRQERDMLLRQVDALTQERERLTLSGNALDTSHQEAEQRFQTAVARFGTLIAQIQSLREKFQQEQQSHQGRWSGVWSWLWARSAPQPEPWPEALYRRLEDLRKEATAEQGRAVDASAKAVRAENEWQLAEARRRFQEAAERPDRLEG